MSIEVTLIDSETEEEFDVTVEFSYHRAYRGYRNSYGVPEEPDEPEDVEIEVARDAEGRDIELNEKQEAKVYEAIWKYIEDSRAEAEADAYFARMED